MDETSISSMNDQFAGVQEVPDAEKLELVTDPTPTRLEGPSAIPPAYDYLYSEKQADGHPKINLVEEGARLFKQYEEDRQCPERVRNLYNFQLNRLFREGYQYSVFGTREGLFLDVEGLLQQVRDDDTARRLTDNPLFDAFDIALANRMQKEPCPDVIPKHNGEKEKENARSARDLILWHWEEEAVSDIREEFLSVKMDAGWGCLKQLWDGFAKVNALIMDGDVYSGCHKTMVVDPEHIVMDRRARKYERMQHLYHVSMRTPEEVAAKWGEQLKKLGKEVPKGSTSTEKSVNDVYGQVKYTMGSEETSARYNKFNDEENVLVLEYWEKPSSTFPRGRVVTLINEIIVSMQAWPYSRWPFLFNQEILTHDSLYGDTAFTHARQVVLIRNECLNTIMTNLADLGGWLVRNFTDKNNPNATGPGCNGVGGRIIFTELPPGTPPYVLSVPDVSHMIEYVINYYDLRIRNLLAVHEFSQFAVPKQGDTLGGLQILIDQFQTRMSRGLRREERMWEQWARNFLELSRIHMPEKNMIRVFDENGDGAYKEFNKAVLYDDLDVNVKPNSLLPSSRILNQAEVDRMWDRGILTDREEYLRLSEFPNAIRMYDQIKMVERIVKAEEDIYFETGIWPAPSPGDDLRTRVSLESKLLLERKMAFLEQGAMIPPDEQQLRETRLALMAQWMQGSMLAQNGMMPTNQPGNGQKGETNA